MESLNLVQACFDNIDNTNAVTLSHHLLHKCQALMKNVSVRHQTLQLSLTRRLLTILLTKFSIDER